MRHTSLALLLVSVLAPVPGPASAGTADEQVILEQIKSAVPKGYVMLTAPWTPHFLALLSGDKDPAGHILQRDPENQGDEFERRRYEAKRRPILDEELGQLRTHGTGKICIQQDGARLAEYDFKKQAFDLRVHAVAEVGSASFNFGPRAAYTLPAPEGTAEALLGRVADRRYSVALNRLGYADMRRLYMVYCGTVSGARDPDGRFFMTLTQVRPILPNW
jgi:hypothetical protein